MALEKTYEVVGTKNMLTRHMTFMVKVAQGDGHVIVPRSVTLKGHIRPRRTRGRLTTSEPALIEAIDQRILNAGRNTGIICVKERDIPDSEAQRTPKIVETKDGEVRFINDVSASEIKKESKPIVQDENPKDDTIPDPDPDPDPKDPPTVTDNTKPPVVSPIKEVTGISRVQDAKLWLLDNIKGLTTREVSNKELITRVAAENKIKFVDLE